MCAVRRDEERIGKEHRQMNIAYDVEFDLDSFLQSMDDPERPAWRRIEDHMERRRLREELSAYDDLDGYLDD
nr:hypothetical protein [Gammaproteobacteria bacterium]